MTVDDAVIALEDLIASYRRDIENPRTGATQINMMERWMGALVFLIAEARKYEFLAGTLAAAGGRPLEFVEHAGEDWS